MGYQDSVGASPPEIGTPITYLYLTHDTDLSGFTPVFASVSSDERLPPRPELGRYTNPLDWPKARKQMMVILSCIATCLTAYTAGAYSPPVDLIAAEFHTTRLAALAGITTFCMGFALAPMVLAPFSEINGRYPVFAIAGVFFTVFQAVCGVATNLATMLVARFLTGVGSSVFSTMVGGVIADMYRKEDRNTPMALFSGAVLAGTGLGPLVTSYMVQQWGNVGQKWKWVFWHQVLLDFVLTVAVIVFFKESRGSVLLSRKAQALNKWYEDLEKGGVYGVKFMGDGLRDLPSYSNGSRESFNTSDENGEKRPLGTMLESNSKASSPRVQRMRWLVKEDEQRASISTMVKVSLTRPFYLLFTEPIVFFFSLWVSFSWAVLYLMFGSVPLVLRRQYHFNTEQSGFVFAAMIVGSIIGTIIGIYQENLLKHPKWQRNEDEGRGNIGSESTEAGKFWLAISRRFPAESPEARLYFACFTAVLLPAGLFLFGFAAQPSCHWIVVAVAVAMSSMGIYYVYLATFNYLADIYHEHASSALAAQSFCRNVLGGLFPLATTALIQNLGEDSAGGLLGAIASVLTVVPWVLVLFGERIRRRSKFAVALEKK